MVTVLVIGLTLPSPVAFAASNRYVDDTAGVNTGDCTVPASPCLTIQYAIGQSVAGDTVNVAAGVYVETVTITKPLTLNGAQAGVDARGRSASESRVSSTNALGTIIIGPAAGTVTLDGLDLTGTPTPGSGGVVYVAGATTNVVVNNTIIESSTADGLLFWNALSGTAEKNWIKGAALSGISGGRDAAQKSDLTIHLNRIDNATYGISGYLDNSSIDDNVITGSASGSAGIGGQFYNTTITNNQVTGYTTGVGLAFQDYLSRGMDSVDANHNSFNGNAAGVYVNLNINGLGITVNRDNISGNTDGVVYGASGAGTLDAECNWWGSSTGPGPVGPGTGDSVDANVDFGPWLVSSNLGGACAISVATAASDAFGNEGTTLSASGSFSHPNPTITANNTFGTFTDNGDGTWTWSYAASDNFAQTTITVHAAAQNGTTADDSFDARADNVAPTATFNSPASAPYGTGFSISLSGPADVSTDMTAGFTYAFDCGGGSFGTASASSAANCTAPLVPGAITVRGKIIDKDGGSTSYAASIQITQPRADAKISKKANRGYKGNNIYSSSVLSSQTRNRRVPRNETRLLYVRIQNDGPATDTFTSTPTSPARANSRSHSLAALPTSPPPCWPVPTA